MTCKLMGGDTALLEQEYYSVGGGFIEWKGYQPPKKGQPKYPYSTMKELQEHAEANKLSIAQIVMANEVGAWQERGGNQCIHRQDRRCDEPSSSRAQRPPSTLPGPISSRPRQAMSTSVPWTISREAAGVGVSSAYALAGSERTGAADLLVTAPTGGSRRRPAGHRLRPRRGAGVAKGEDDERILAAGRSAILQAQCNAVGAEGGCEAESAWRPRWRGIRSHKPTTGHQVVANAAESALQHQLGVDLRPGRRLRASPMHRTVRFWSRSTWTGFMIASNEIPTNRRVDFDTTVTAMALTAKEMNSKYKRRRKAAGCSLVSADHETGTGAASRHGCWAASTYLYSVRLRSALEIMVRQL